mgnify:CR=1 FL=1
MGKLRAFPTKEAIKQNMQRGRWEPFFTADYMRDFHQMVINNIGEMIGRHAIAFIKDFIVNVLAFHSNMPAYEIIKFDNGVFGHFEPNSKWCATVKQVLYFAFRHGKRVTHVFS